MALGKLEAFHIGHQNRVTSPFFALQCSRMFLEYVAVVSQLRYCSWGHNGCELDGVKAGLVQTLYELNLGLSWQVLWDVLQPIAWADLDNGHIGSGRHIHRELAIPRAASNDKGCYRVAVSKPNTKRITGITD